MKTENVMTLAVTSASDKLEGLIITGDIAESYMDVYDNHILSRARTQYKNIVETLNGTPFSQEMSMPIFCVEK